MKLLSVVLLALSMSPLGFTQETDFNVKAGAVVSGSKQGATASLGIATQSKGYKISGSIGRQSHDYLVVGDVDALLKKEIQIGSSKNSFVLGYSPISLQSSSILNRTEALATPKVGMTRPKTLILYSISPLASITQRETGQTHKAIMHGVEVEQNIGELLKLWATVKVSSKDGISYFNSNNQLVFKMNDNLKIFGFYDSEMLKGLGTNVVNNERNPFPIKLDQTTVGVGVKLTIGASRK